MSWLLDVPDHAEEGVDSLLDWICTPKHGGFPAGGDLDTAQEADGDGTHAVPFAAIEYPEQHKGKVSEGSLWPISAKLDSVAVDPLESTPAGSLAGVVPDCLVPNGPVTSTTGWSWDLQVRAAAPSGQQYSFVPNSSLETQFSTSHLITPEAPVVLPCSRPAAAGASGSAVQFRAPGSPPAAVPELLPQAWDPSYMCSQQQQSLFEETFFTPSLQVVPRTPSAPAAAAEPTAPGLWPSPFANSVPAAHMQPSTVDVSGTGQFTGCEQMAPGLLYSVAQTAPQHSSAGMQAPFLGQHGSTGIGQVPCSPFMAQHSSEGMGALSCAPISGQYGSAGLSALSCAPVMGQHISTGTGVVRRTAGMGARSCTPMFGLDIGAVVVSTPAGLMMMPCGYLQLPASARPDYALAPCAGAGCAGMGCFGELQSSTRLPCQSYRHTSNSTASATAQSQSTFNRGLPRSGSIGSFVGQLAGPSPLAGAAAEAVLAAAAPQGSQATDLSPAQALKHSSILASIASRRSKAAAVADCATGRLGSNSAGQAGAGLTGTLGSSNGCAQIRPPTMRRVNSTGKTITKTLRPARNSLKQPRAGLADGSVNLPFLTSAFADADNQAQDVSSRNSVLQAAVDSLALSKTQLTFRLATLRADLASLAADNHHLQGANMELKAQVQAAMQQAQRQGCTVPPLP